MKEVIIKKGYEIDLRCVYEGYMYSDTAVSANSKSAARYQLLKYAHDAGMTDIFDKEFTYISLRIKRCKEADVIIFNGEEMSRWKAKCEQSKIEFNKKLDDILKDEDISFCYIKKRGSYYCDDYNGYTEFKLKAGIYPKKDAVRHAKGCMEITLVPINVKEHNAYISAHIEDLKNRIIQPF